MYLGTQIRPRDDSDYRVWAQFGVNHVCVDPPGNPHDWTVDALQPRARAGGEVLADAGYGAIAAVIAADRGGAEPGFLLGQDPERQRELDSICRLIERIGAAGIPAAKYNFNLIGIPRTAHEPGRGGSRNAAFRWRATDQSAPPGRAGAVSEERTGQRIDRFLAAVVPVAEAAKYAWPVIRTIPHPARMTGRHPASLAPSTG